MGDLCRWREDGLQLRGSEDEQRWVVENQRANEIHGFRDRIREFDDASVDPAKRSTSLGYGRR